MCGCVHERTSDGSPSSQWVRDAVGGSVEVAALSELEQKTHSSKDGNPMDEGRWDLSSQAFTHAKTRILARSDCSDVVWGHAKKSGRSYWRRGLITALECLLRICSLQCSWDRGAAARIVTDVILDSRCLVVQGAPSKFASTFM